jgi:hypothetical protein
MGLTYSRGVRAEPGEVSAWHSRPGTITRPMPPWQSARVVREAPSVRDGPAVLPLRPAAPVPGGLLPLPGSPPGTRPRTRARAVRPGPRTAAVADAGGQGG